jgi:hypothetical protein
VLGYSWCFHIIYGLCVLGIGFALGRRYGKREGILLGRSEAPLLLRYASLLLGHCLLCQESATVDLSEQILASSSTSNCDPL